MARGQAAQDGQVDVSQYPECLQPLAKVFIANFHRNAHDKSERAFWIDGLWTIYLDEVEPGQLEKAMQEMEKEGLSIKSPRSVQAKAYDIKRRKVTRPGHQPLTLADIGF
jgi:hypothetical protein